MERVLFGAMLVLVAIPMVLLTLVLLVGGVQFLSEEHPWLMVAGAAVAVAVSVALVKRQGRPTVAGPLDARHPGITMHRIPVTGGVGLAFVVGYVFMFWYGAPSMRPLVVALPLLGALVAGIYIWIGERRG